MRQSPLLRLDQPESSRIGRSAGPYQTAASRVGRQARSAEGRGGPGSQSSPRGSLRGGDFETAERIMFEIPETLRTPAMESLLIESRARTQEAAGLTHTIESALRAGELLEVEPAVRRLQRLRPDCPVSRNLAVRVGLQFCRAAAERLAEHQYDAALKLLGHVPEVAVDSRVQELQRRAVGLSSLSWALRHAPYVDNTLVAIAKQLSKLAPDYPKRSAAERRVETPTAAGLRSVPISAGRVGGPARADSFWMPDRLDDGLRQAANRRGGGWPCAEAKPGRFSGGLWSGVARTGDGPRDHELAAGGRRSKHAATRRSSGSQQDPREHGLGNRHRCQRIEGNQASIGRFR